MAAALCGHAPRALITGQASPGDGTPAPPDDDPLGNRGQDKRRDALKFDTRGQRLYYRQSVTVLREGRRIATATVNRRFTAQNAAATQIIEAVEEVKTGDTVVAQSGDAEP